MEFPALRTGLCMPRPATAARTARQALLVALLLMSGACGQRDAAKEAAIALAEAIYPGELEFHDTTFRTTHYDVTLRIRDDPVTRTTFQVDADPADCVPGSACETRLRRAYAHDSQRGRVLTMIDRAFSTCGVPVLAQTEPGFEVNQPPVEPIIELALTNVNQAEELSRLTPCLSDFWSGLSPADRPEFLMVRILLQAGDTPASAPSPLTIEARIPDHRIAEPGYQVLIPTGLDQRQPCRPAV